MAKVPTGAELLNVPMDPKHNGAEALSVREYLIAFLKTAAIEGANFSGKRPFGSSCWEFDIYRAMVAAEVLDGEIDTDDTLKDCNEELGKEYLMMAISALGEIPGSQVIVADDGRIVLTFRPEAEAIERLIFTAAPDMRDALEATLSWMTNVNVNDPATLGRQIMEALELAGVPKEDLDSAAVALVRGPCAVPNLMGDENDRSLSPATIFTTRERLIMFTALTYMRRTHQQQDGKIFPYPEVPNFPRVPIDPKEIEKLAATVM